MRLSNLEEVQKLVEIYARLNRALDSCDEWVDRYGADEDSGGTDQFKLGYSCLIHAHRDGSGSGIDMNGCYVGLEVAEATKRILQAQLDNVKSALKDYGVDPNA